MLIDEFPVLIGGTQAAPQTQSQSFTLENCPGGLGSNRCSADTWDLQWLGGLPIGTCLGTDQNQSFTQAFSLQTGPETAQKNFPLSITNSVSKGNFNRTLKADITITNK